MLPYDPIIQNIKADLFEEKKLNVSVLRLDLIHENISGNKWFKLKYNFEQAKREGYDTVLTFGGTFSNHIHATAAACRAAGFKCIGIIRGEKESADNPTLSEAVRMGMRLHFVSREEYKKKYDAVFVESLRSKFGKFFLVPEGGNSRLGALGCADILTHTTEYSHVFCACGTGTTFSGIAKSLSEKTTLVGVSVLKGGQTMIAESKVLRTFVPKQTNRIGGAI